MGYVVLIAGLALWFGAHLFKRIAPERRARLGDPGKGLVALLLVLSIVLMVLGYRGADYVYLWPRFEWATHLNNLLNLVAVFLFVASNAGGWVGARMRHPQLTAVKVWAVAHLLVNGELAALVLFGGLLAWAVVEVIVINRALRAGPGRRRCRRTPRWRARAGTGRARGRGGRLPRRRAAAQGAGPLVARRGRARGRARPLRRDRLDPHAVRALALRLRPPAAETCA